MRKPPPTPKVTRQELLWVPETRRVEIQEHPYRVWTLYGSTSHDTKPSLPITPVHLNGAFLEDFIHDWNVDRTGGKLALRYYSRAIESRVWILVEYAENNPFTRKR